MAWKSSFRQNYWTTFSPTVPTSAAGDLSHRGGRGGTWWRKWERLNAGKSNGKLPLRTCPGCIVPEPYQSTDWALVSAQPAQGLNTSNNIYGCRFSVFFTPSSVSSYYILYELSANIIPILFIFKIYSITNISYARFCYTDSAVYFHPILIKPVTTIIFINHSYRYIGPNIWNIRNVFQTKLKTHSIRFSFILCL